MHTYTETEILSMSQQIALDTYNQYAPVWRKAKFKNKEEALKALKKVGAVSAEPVETASKAPKPTQDKPKAPAPIATTHSTVEVAREEMKKARKPSDPERPQGVTNAHRAHWAKKFKFLVKENPRRPHSLLSMYWDFMVESKTVGEYLSKFEDRKAASQALSNQIKDGYVELV